MPAKDGDTMATSPTQVRIDADIKKQTAELFSALGLDMSSAINLFLHQCVLRGGLPFSVEMPGYRKRLLEAVKEAKHIARDRGAEGYDGMGEMKSALES